MLADRSNKPTIQACRNSRTNLTDILERRREAPARQTSTSHYGNLSTNIKTVYCNEVVFPKVEKVRKKIAVTPEQI